MKKRSNAEIRKAKNVTMDELARMMAGGFTEMGQRFDELDNQLTGRIEELDERLTGQIKILNEKVNIVNTNVLSLQFDYRKVVNRIQNLELKTFGSVQE